MSYSSEVLADSPLAYFRLDETSGTSAADSSGNGRTGTYVNTPTLGATSLLADGSGHSMGLTANAGQRMDITWFSGLNGLATALSVECLVDISSAVDAGSGDGIVTWFRSQTHFLLWRNGAGKAAFRVYLSNGSSYEAASSATLTGSHHLVGTWDGSTVKVFVDGTQAGSLATAASTLLTGTPDVIEVGTYAATAATSPGASVDEVAIYDAALSSTRIAAHYTAATTVPASATVTAVAATATAAAAVPVVSASNGVAAVAATATAAALPPSVSGTSTATVSPPAAAATAAALAPTLTAHATVAGVVATATAAALAPSVSASVAATVVAVPATATAAAVAPVVTDGSGNRTVFAVRATATASAPAPVWTQVLGVATDTTNEIDGLELVGVATVTVTRAAATAPATLVLADRYDKAVPYPVPSVSNGRVL